MPDIWSADGTDVLVQTLFEKHAVFTTTEELLAEDLADFLNENGYHLPAYLGPKD